MKRSNRLVILVGVLLAVLAFVGIVVVLNGQGATNNPNGQAPTSRVLVAKAAIAIGDPVTPDTVEVKEVDPGAVGPDSLTDPSQVGGQPALTNVAAGSQVTKATIGTAGGGVPVDLSASLKAGERAVGVQVDRVTGADFLIQEGDTIDIILRAEVPAQQRTADSAADPNAPPRYETIPGLTNPVAVKTVLQNKRVIYVSAVRSAQVVTGNDAQASQAPQALPDKVIIIFAGTDQDAELLKFIQNDTNATTSDLTAIVRSGEDSGGAAVTTSGVTLELLTSKFGVPIPAIVLPQQAKP